MPRTNVFISYSHRDERWRQRVVDHLAVLAEEGLIELWDDRKIEAGQDWLAIVNEKMQSARIAMLLVSPSFLTSRFIRDKEVPSLFARHAAEGMTVYPLLVRPCPWQVVHWLAAMQMRPADAKPLASLRGARAEEVLAAIALEIAAVAGRDGAPGAGRGVGLADRVKKLRVSEPRRAAGMGGRNAGGDAKRNINTGTQIEGDYVRGDKVRGDKIGKQINTGGGAYIGGNVRTGGDFISRDQVRVTGAGRGGRGESAGRISAGARRLAELLDDFSVSELEGLCLELGIDWNALEGESKNAKALSMVHACEQRDKLGELKRLMRVARPKLRGQFV